MCVESVFGVCCKIEVISLNANGPMGLKFDPSFQPESCNQVPPGQVDRAVQRAARVESARMRPKQGKDEK